MKKAISLITSISLLFSAPLIAQEETKVATEETEDDDFFVPPPPKPIDRSEMQNWLFAGGTILCATAAVILVALNPGKAPPPGQRTLPQ